MDSPINYSDICEFGKCYYPATDHYPHLSSVDVICDRCKITNLDACIGWNDFDLCMNCVNIVKGFKRKSKKKLEIVPQQKVTVHSRIDQKQNFPVSPPVMLMMQYQFQPIFERRAIPAPLIDDRLSVPLMMQNEFGEDDHTIPQYDESKSRMAQLQFSPNTPSSQKKE